MHAEDGIRDEFDALRLVEFVGRPNEAEVPLVDQIREGDTLILILFGDGHDESEIRPDQSIECLLVILPDTLRELHFLLATDEGKDADVPEVLIERSFVDGRFPIRRYLHSDSIILSRAGSVLVNDLPEALPPQMSQPVEAVSGVRRVTIIDHYRLAAHKRVGHEPPIPRIRRVVAIISEDEVVMRRDDQRTPVVTGWMIVFDRRAADQIGLLPAEFVVGLVGLRGRALDVVFRYRLTVSDQCCVTHLKRVARNSDDALDVIEPRIDRVREDDHVPVPGSVEGGQLHTAAGNPGAVDQLVDQEKVALEQRVLHAAAGDLERLHAEGADDDEESERHDDDPGPVGKERELAAASSPVGKLKGVRPFVFGYIHDRSIPR